ncbi:MAG: N-6 DNA methylase [Chitinophagaceae bacterium]|nr:N-6 DNA methylase [Chitinophagaceae bacterium]
MKTKQTFESLMDQFQDHFDLHTVFDDFLTIAIALCGRNPHTGRSFDEALYLQVIEKYKHHDLRCNFPKMLSTLTLQVTERIESNQGCDILGEYYESRLGNEKTSELFIPYPICRFMARSAISNVERINPKTRFQVLDPECGSGRMMIDMAFVSGKKHHYFGIDSNLTFVKMTVLSLFLCGVVSAEVMCADADIPHDFHGSYKISLWPYGIFRQDVKERSQLWRVANSIVLPTEMSKVHQN